MLHTLATIPAPPFDVIDVGPITLHLYGLLVGIGIVVGMTVGERLLNARGIPTERYYSVLVPAVFMGFVGARLYHVLSEPVRYAGDPADIIAVWNGGLGIYGGVLFGAATAWVLARRFGIPRGELLDAGAVGLPVAQAIGRLGNYVNQELFGRPTDFPWGLEVDPEHRPAALQGECCFHPTFLYEAVANLLLFAVLLFLHRRWRGRPPAVLFALYVAGYSAIRFVVEGMRSDQAHEWLGLRQNEWIALGLLVLASATAAVLLRRHRAASRVS